MLNEDAKPPWKPSLVELTDVFHCKSQNNCLDLKLGLLLKVDHYNNTTPTCRNHVATENETLSFLFKSVKDNFEVHPPLTFFNRDTFYISSQYYYTILVINIRPRTSGVKCCIQAAVSHI